MHAVSCALVKGSVPSAADSRTLELTNCSSATTQTTAYVPALQKMRGADGAGVAEAEDDEEDDGVSDDIKPPKGRKKAAKAQPEAAGEGAAKKPASKKPKPAAAAPAAAPKRAAPKRAAAASAAARQLAAGALGHMARRLIHMRAF